MCSLAAPTVNEMRSRNHSRWFLVTKNFQIRPIEKKRVDLSNGLALPFGDKKATYKACVSLGDFNEFAASVRVHAAWTI